MIHVPSAQPIAIMNPHTNQTSNAFAETSGNMTRSPFVQQDVLAVAPRERIAFSLARAFRRGECYLCSAISARLRPTWQRRFFWPHDLQGLCICVRKSSAEPQHKGRNSSASQFADFPPGLGSAQRLHLAFVIPSHATTDGPKMGYIAKLSLIKIDHS
jgi:hypothetical protein